MYVLSACAALQVGAQRLAHTGHLATHFLFFSDAAPSPGATTASTASTTAAAAAVQLPSATTPDPALLAFYSYAGAAQPLGAPHHWGVLKSWLSAAEAGVGLSVLSAASASAASASGSSASAAASSESARARPQRPLRIALLGPVRPPPLTSAAQRCCSLMLLCRCGLVWWGVARRRQIDAGGSALSGAGTAVHCSAMQRSAAQRSAAQRNAMHNARTIECDVM